MIERDLRARLTTNALSNHGEDASQSDALQLRLAVIDALRDAALPAPELRLPADLVRARLTAGVPLLDGVYLPVAAEADRLLTRLAVVFRTDPAHEAAATAILSAVQSHRLHVEQLVSEAVVSHADHLAALASAAGVNPELLAVLADLTARPLLASVAERLRPALRLAPWPRPYCPVCGAYPTFGELPFGGHFFGEHQGVTFTLRCGRCATAWAWTLPACPLCPTGADGRLSQADGRLPQMDTSTSDSNLTVSVVACDRCKSYVRIVEGQEMASLVDILVYDLATWTTDRAALLQGWAAPSRPPRRLEHGDAAVEDLDDD